MLFWIIEDFLWFVLNPAFGIAGFVRKNIPWHKQWFLNVPVDYWTFTMVSAFCCGCLTRNSGTRETSLRSRQNGDGAMTTICSSMVPCGRMVWDKLMPLLLKGGGNPIALDLPGTVTGRPAVPG